MAVQKSRKSRSKRGMRRAHDQISQPQLSTDSLGMIHLRHHMAENGTYRGRQIIKLKKEETEATQEQQA